MDLTHLRETNRADRSIRQPTLIAAAAAMALFLAAPDAALAMNFPDALKRVDYGLQKNPARVPAVALDSCRKRRDFAVKLYEAREIDRAEQSLKTCFDLLKISETPTKSNEKAGPSIAEFQAEAAREIEEALDLTPNIEKGLEIYRGCASCHKPEGWGLKNGSVPQVAGQHHTVVIKQLADIRAGNRSNPMMLRHASVAAVGGPQAVADVAGYIATLKISPENGKGFGRDLELGERLYGEHCARCHGAAGEGDAEKHVPRIQARHYKYLVRQFRWIRDGKRLNANAEKVVQIDGFKDSEAKAVLDYVSRLEPPPELRAPADWRNPDFAD
jgi:cytochrome c553